MIDKNILFIIGTRPELIKVAPLVKYFRNNGIGKLKVVNTGQHRELLGKYWDIFDLKADVDLDVIKAGQDLSSLTERALNQINQLVCDLEGIGSKPDYILAQGDTTTVMATSMVSFYNNIKFFHLEAGLRSHSMAHPFPEEFNRRLASITAYHHFAPTEGAKINLLNEKIEESSISIVGNTVIDALNIIRKSPKYLNVEFNDESVKLIMKTDNDKVLITCHRRENQNRNLQNLIEIIDQLSRENENTYFIWPVHPNPNIKNNVYNSILSKRKNVVLCEPLDYLELIKVLEKCKIVLSDSGGIQEEAPSFKVPVLILRDSTERPEAVLLGYSKIVGCDKEKIRDSFYNFKPTFSELFVSPYGDGNSSERIFEVFKRIG